MSKLNVLIAVVCYTALALDVGVIVLALKVNWGFAAFAPVAFGLTYCVACDAKRDWGKP